MENTRKLSGKLYSGDYSFLEGKKELVVCREGGAGFLDVPKELGEEIGRRWRAFIQRQGERSLYTENGDIVCTSPSYWVNGTGMYYVIACPSEFRIFSVTRPKFRQKQGRTRLDEMEIFRLGSASLCTVEIMGSDYTIFRDDGKLHLEPWGFMEPADLKMKESLENQKMPLRYTLQRAGREKIVPPYEMEEDGVMMSEGSRNVISCFDARMRTQDIEDGFRMKDGRGYEKDSIFLQRKDASRKGGRFFLYPKEYLGDFVQERGKDFDQRTALFLKRYFERA